jgi:phosphoribosylglycinamide formyltransferase-1
MQLAMPIESISTAILCSGSGSNMESIVKACNLADLPLSVDAVITNNPNAYCLERAKNLGVYAHTLPKGKDVRDVELIEILKKKNIKLILLAGYLKKIPDQLIAGYKNKILNIHPSLLPKYGGAGMYGIKVHEAVHAAKELKSGATVHIVTEEFDEGPIILQGEIDIAPADTPEEIAKKVLSIEHSLYVQAIQKYLTLGYI